MNYNGFVWWSKNKTEKGTNYYACSRKGCPATLTVTIDLQYRERGKHSTECLAEKMKKQKQNLLNEFQEEILKQTLNFYKTPSQIYLEVKEKMIKKSEDTNLPISFPSQNSIINQISKERKLHFPYDLIFMLTEPPFSLTDDGLIFWRGSNSIMIGNKKESFIIWTTDKLSGLLLQNSQSFFDGTFLIAPKPFKQLLVIMGFDSETETYYPCIYALLTGKQMELYVQCFEYIKNTLLQNKWNPKFITCDFERSLLTAICKVFPTSKLVGCYFHFKQALQRWCTKRGLMNESMKSSTGSLLLEIEVLTLIEPNLIIPTIKTLESKYPNQSLFWNYFKHTWLSIFPPNLWNIHFFKGIVQRTNNVIERNNRSLNNLVNHQKPLLMEFLQVIKEEDNKWRKKLDENRDSRSQKQLNIYPLDPNSLTYQWLEKVDLKLEFEYMLEEKNLLTGNQILNLIQKNQQTIQIMSPKEKHVLTQSIDSNESTNTEKVKIEKESNSNSNPNILDIHNDSSLKLIPSLKEKLISPKIESNSLPFQSKMNYFLQKDASKQLNINIPSTKKRKDCGNEKFDIILQSTQKMGKKFFNDSQKVDKIDWEKIVNTDSIFDLSRKKIYQEMQRRQIKNISLAKKHELIKKFRTYLNQ